MAEGRRPQLHAPPALDARRGTLGEDEFALLEWRALPPRDPDALTPAEKHVLELLLAGLSNARIAARRGTSQRTVANQVAAIFFKLGVRSRPELFASIAARRARGGRATTRRRSRLRHRIDQARPLNERS